MKVVFSDWSRARLHEIQAYIAFFNSRAAVRVVDRIIYAAEMLEDHPWLGANWCEGPTRALVVPGIHYRVHPDAVGIITIVHVRQKAPYFGR
ncbi:type II toxin-antitoxin system RelE/ParE family toxin [Cereibacter sphaeroides]|uniref:type II toxin-antitoxin system RelE/ParE family toxin n=1 Tax=Cereibacter sphaeroides TaxID=1063 RepID=UPI001F1A5691|nr:type II toxin-antitoxin system RelE/ParE family toxin [Cereibacter sphaeroides]MCE6949929.1 type II toxin-antitoxin system RelE/ParE family toxin [Cereibacter sphaeroides]